MDTSTTNTRSKTMNPKIMKQAGFGKEVELVNAGMCPFCKKAVFMNDFKNEISRKEYRISGFCQKCQDELFGKD